MRGRTGDFGEEKEGKARNMWKRGNGTARGGRNRDIKGRARKGKY